MRRVWNLFRIAATGCIRIIRANSEETDSIVKQTKDAMNRVQIEERRRRG